MDFHGAIVNTILSFEGSFTYRQLIDKIIKDDNIDLNNKDVISQVVSKIKEIFELPSIKVVPLSNPTQYYVVGNI